MKFSEIIVIDESPNEKGNYRIIEQNRLKKKVYTILTALKSGDIVISGLFDSKKYHYKFKEDLFNDIKGDGNLLSYGYSMNRETNQPIFEPHLRLKSNIVNIWNENGNKVDFSDFNLRLVLTVIAKKFENFGIDVYFD